MKRMGWIAGFVMGILVAGCGVSEETAVRVLEDEGYTNVRVGDYAWFGCGEEDVFQSHWSAERDGRHVHGVICCGYWKSCTVRH